MIWMIVVLSVLQGATIALLAIMLRTLCQIQAEEKVYHSFARKVKLLNLTPIQQDMLLEAMQKEYDEQGSDKVAVE